MSGKGQGGLEGFLLEFDVLSQSCALFSRSGLEPKGKQGWYGFFSHFALSEA